MLAALVALVATAAVSAASIAAASNSAPTARNPVVPISTLMTQLTAKPSPLPKPSDGRIPTSLLLANRIWDSSGSHPPATTEMQFDLDRHYRLDLSGIRACKELRGLQSSRNASPCEGFEEIGRGTIKFEVLIPEEEPVTIKGNALTYKRGPRSLMVWTYLPAPIAGAVLIPVTIGSSDGRFGLRAKLTIPKVADSAGSLTYLGLRFRKGLFSLACSHLGLQSRSSITFADGDRAGGSLIQTC